MEKYDEDILDNPFFIALQSKHLKLFEITTSHRCIVCVPRYAACVNVEFNRTDFEDHIFVSPEEGCNLLNTVSSKEAVIEDGFVSLQKGFSAFQKVQILFEETFYNTLDETYRVLCVDHMFNGESVSPSQRTPFQSLPSSYSECTELLWGHSGAKKTQDSLDRMLNNFSSSYDQLHGSHLRNIVDTASSHFTKSMQIVLKDPTLKRSAKHSPMYMESIKVATETYVLHTLNKHLFGSLTSCVASEDAEINKCTRNLKDLQACDIGIKINFQDNIPLARKEMARLNKYSTPLGKLFCIKRVVLALSRFRKNSSPSVQKEATEMMTTDDLLPLLIFLVVKSEIPNWMANLLYMQHFHFSRSSNKDEFGYYLTSIEASMEQIKSGRVKEMMSGPLNTKVKWYQNTSNLVDSPQQTAAVKTEFSSVDKFFEFVQAGDEKSVKSFLSHQNKAAEEAQRRLCHPLCCCKGCEKLAAESRRDSSLVTAFTRDEMGYTALHVAAAYGHGQLIDILVDRGAAINATDYLSCTPLHLACQKGFQNIILLLVHFGADPCLKDNDGNTPLHLCTANGHEKCVKALVFSDCGTGKLDLNAMNDAGNTPLHLAAKWGYEEIVRTLLENVAQTDVRNKKKQTPISCAHNAKVKQILQESSTTNKHLMMIKSQLILIKKKHLTKEIPEGPLKLESNQSSSPIDAALLRRKELLFKAITDDDSQLVCFYMGFNESTEETANPADISTDDLCHPLCQCSKCEPLQNMLLENRATVAVDCVDSQGFTPLHRAAQDNREELLQLLIAKGADINLSTHAGLTPLHTTCLKNNCKLTTILLDHGAKVNRGDRNGNSPLHHSCQAGNLVITALLLKYGALVNQHNNRGSTCLHEAVCTNNIDLVSLLLEAGANIRITNQQHISPLHLAQDVCIKRLLSKSQPATSQTGHLKKNAPIDQRLAKVTTDIKGVAGSECLAYGSREKPAVLEEDETGKDGVSVTADANRSKVLRENALGTHCEDSERAVQDNEDVSNSYASSQNAGTAEWKME